MTNYNDGKWHGWNGGECPVHPKTTVEIVYLVNENGIAKFDTGNSVKFTWNAVYAKIVAFRVVKEYKEPREFWVAVGYSGNVVDATKERPSDPYGYVKVREVMDNE